MNDRLRVIFVNCFSTLPLSCQRNRLRFFAQRSIHPFTTESVLSLGQFFRFTVFNQQVPTDEIRQTRAVLDAIVSDDGATWGKFGSSEEIFHLLRGVYAHDE